jgi:hypothetical protein
MFWPARSGLAFFFGLRCAGGVVAIVVLSFRARRGGAMSRAADGRNVPWWFVLNPVVAEIWD